MSDDKPTPDLVRDLLRQVHYPGFPRDVVSLGVVGEVSVEGKEVSISLRLPGGRTDVPPVLEKEIVSALAAHGLRARLASAVGAAAPATTRPGPAVAEGAELPGVHAVIAVSSAKGGVGKSTVATNLACALSTIGLKVGLLDADVYGPSLPIMMGTDARPHAAGGNRFHPVERHGVRCVSMGFFLDDSSPVIWRGPMVAGLVRQFLNDCVWGELDVLVIDLPPGTGDAQLTLAQQVKLDGALIVTTPQDVALRDVVRGVAMFRQLQIPVLGVIENMSVFVCPECGDVEEIFGRGAGETIARAADAPLLAQIPLDVRIREEGDRGRPIVLAEPGAQPAQTYRELAHVLAARIGAGVPGSPAAHA
ncbi:MAG: Mrp/NBP35 family ATP-binding protein [Deltaproteobacteria bacterium]|nr:Mrp/NBP35 family ATP-binding protein [Deltaproteobacteria bacterium]